MFLRYESLPTYFKKYPVTSSLILFCIGVFLYITFFTNASSAWTLYEYGAFHGESVKDGEWYRFFTATFIHDGWMHLLMNGFFLYVFGPYIETILGKIKFPLFFVVTGSGSYLLSFFFTPNTVGVGVSGALYALFALYLFLIWKKPYLFSAQDKQTVIALTIISFVFTFITPNVSLLGHTGGFIVGFILSFIFVKK